VLKLDGRRNRLKSQLLGVLAEAIQAVNGKYGRWVPPSYVMTPNKSKKAAIWRSAEVAGRVRALLGGELKTNGFRIWRYKRAIES